MPVIVQRQLLWSRRLKTAKVPQLTVLLGGRCPCCAGSSRRPVLDKVVDMPVIVNDSVSTVEVPQIQFIAC